MLPFSDYTTNIDFMAEVQIIYSEDFPPTQDEPVNFDA